MSRSPTRHTARSGIAVDIGGSKIESAESNAPGTTHRVPTDPGAGPDGLCHQVVTAIRRWSVTAGERIVIASAGDLDRQAGTVVAAANLPWRDYPLRDTIATATECEVELIGDATAGALAELTHPTRARHGAGIYVTVSTGIGMGVIRARRLDWRVGIGDRELGHVQVDPGSDAELCGCGRRGCLEAYSSGRAIVRRYRHAAGVLGTVTSGGPAQPASGVPATPASGVPDTVADVIAAADAGDDLARRIVDEALDHLTNALAGVATEVSATVIVLGGGVMVHTGLFSLLNARLRDVAGPQLSIEPAVHGVYSTIHGAAALCERESRVMAVWGEGG